MQVPDETRDLRRADILFGFEATDFRPDELDPGELGLQVRAEEADRPGPLAAVRVEVLVPRDPALGGAGRQIYPEVREVDRTGRGPAAGARGRRDVPSNGQGVDPAHLGAVEAGDLETEGGSQPGRWLPLPRGMTSLPPGFVVVRDVAAAKRTVRKAGSLALASSAGTTVSVISAPPNDCSTATV